MNESETDPELQVPFGHDPKVSMPVMDDEDDHKEDYREAARKAVGHWKGVFRAMLIFKGDPAFALRCTIAAHGFWDLLSERDQVEIASRFRCTRANAAKLTGLIQRRLGLPPTLGQRGIEGRQNMYKARKKQLQHIRD